MLYTIAIQNLRLQVSVPDSADTAALDKVIREFNDHLMTFNGGKPVELFESKEIKLLIFTLISFILGMQKKNRMSWKKSCGRRPPPYRRTKVKK